MITDSFGEISETVGSGRYMNEPFSKHIVLFVLCHVTHTVRFWSTTDLLTLVERHMIWESEL